MLDPTWGATHTPLPRQAAGSGHAGAYYPGDGSGQRFAGGPGSPSALPEPRLVSKLLFDSPLASQASTQRLSSMVWQWGQFIDHDITLVETSSDPVEAAPIEVDPSDPMAPGIPFQRSRFAAGTGTSAANPRQQLNSITSYIDASNIYGSDPVRAATLRAAGGRLRMSAGNLLPYNLTGMPNAGGTSSSMMLAGDVRANEQLALTAMHTLFVREHNRLVGLLETDFPIWDDEQLYQTARKMVGAELQAITYREFLPALLGKNDPLLPKADDFQYDAQLNPSISNEFATSIYRFGHSMLPSHLLLAPVDGLPAERVPLKNAFFTPDFFTPDHTGSPQRIERLLLGLTQQMAMEIDPMAIDDVRNFLFGPPGAGGLDLTALNIQRGRDHGLPDYNAMRAAYDLDPVASLADISQDPAVVQTLASLYDSVDSVDAWVGALAEDHLPGAAVGELIRAAMLDQFVRLRDGDRYFFSGDAELVDNPAVTGILDLESITLSQILAWNTTLSELPENVFLIAVPEPTSLLLFLPMTLGICLCLRRKRFLP